MISNIKILYEDGHLDKHIENLIDDPNQIIHIYYHLEQGEAIRPIDFKYPIAKEIKFIFGSDDCPFYDEFKEVGSVEFFWNYWLYGELVRMDTSHLKTITSQSFEKLLLVLNNLPKKHRKIMMSELDKNGLLENSFYSWLTPTSDSGDSIWKTSKIIWEGQETQHTLPSQPISKKSFQFGFPEQVITPIEYYKTLMVVVNETCDKTIFFTEKTWLPLLLGRPFLINGGMGMHHRLKEYGFKLYDELFDYSFDLETESDVRIDGIIQNIKSINGNYKLLNESIKSKLRYNQEVCFNMIENKVGVPVFDGVNNDMWDRTINSAQQNLKTIKDILLKF